MLIITKENNSIKVVGQNNPTYPYSGTLVYPLNSVTVVTDQSDMAVFRSALNNDVLFTGLIDDITIAGSTVTKEDIGTKFGAISNSSSTGGGGTGGGAVDSVNGQTGTVVLSASDVNAYAKNEVDGLLSAKVGVDVYNRDIPTLATKEELALKADKSSLGDYLLKTEAQSNYETISGAQGKYQAKLTAGTGIEITGENVINVTLDTNIYQVVESLPESEINPNKIYLVLSTESGETNLYTEYLYVNSKWEKIGEYKADVDLTPYLKSSEAASTYATKQELAGEVSEREKQDSALGGMIAGETEAREQAITNLTATVQGKLDTATYNSEKATFETKENAAATYQPKGSYLTSIPEEYVTDTELNGKGYATQEWVGEQGYLTEHQDISGLATKEELNGKQDTLVSGTNIKTINSQSLLGEGNIEITVQGGGITDAPNDGKLYGRKSEQWTEVVIPDTSNLATKDELNGKANLDGAVFTGNVAVPDLSINDSSDGVMFNVSKQSRDILFRTMNAGVDSVSFQVQSAYPLKLTEAGIMENNQLLETKYAKVDDIPTDYITNEDLTPYETKENAQATYQIKGEYATTAQLNTKQDTLVSGTNIKTINGNTILGEGNIQIETTGGGITDAPSDDKTYGRKNGAWSEITQPDLSNYALKSEVPTQYVTNFTGTDNGFSILQAGSSDARGGLTFGEGFTVVNSRNTPSVSIDTETIATKEDLNGKQNTLVSGTNIKTVNGNSLLGSGDITIEGGGTSGGGTETYDFKGTSRCAELTYDVVKEGVILQNITLSGMNITTNGVLITLAKFDNNSAIGFALLSEGKYSGTNKPFLAQVLFSNVGGATISKYVSTTPTAQEGAEGTETNYIYSDKTNAMYRAIAMASPGTIGDGEGGSTAGIVLRYWGDDVVNPLKFDYATSTRGGMMRSKDKNKLDTLQTEWFGTQSQFDGLESKDENTLYFITEE